MPTILRIKGYRFGFFSADIGEPPHVHVSRDANQAKFWIEPVELAKNAGFTRHDLNEVFDLVRENQEELLRRWHEYFG